MNDVMYQMEFENEHIAICENQRTVVSIEFDDTFCHTYVHRFGVSEVVEPVGAKVCYFSLIFVTEKQAPIQKYLKLDPSTVKNYDCLPDDSARFVCINSTI